MKFRWLAWVSLLVVVPPLALACGDGGDNGEEPPATEPVPTRPLGDPDTEEEDLLASMLLTTDEVAEVLPGDEWRIFSREFFGQEPPLGQVVGSTAGYQPQMADTVTVSTTFLLFETAEDASKGFLDLTRSAMGPGPGVEIEQFDAGPIGDEAYGQVTRLPQVYTSVVFFLRVDRVLANLSLVLGLSDEERQEEVLQLAQRLAEKIEAAVQG